MSEKFKEKWTHTDNVPNRIAAEYGSFWFWIDGSEERKLDLAKRIVTDHNLALDLQGLARTDLIGELIKKVESLADTYDMTEFKKLIAQIKGTE